MASSMRARSDLAQLTLDAFDVGQVRGRVPGLVGVDEKQSVDRGPERVGLLALLVLVVHSGHKSDILLVPDSVLSATEQKPAGNAHLLATQGSAAEALQGHACPHGAHAGRHAGTQEGMERMLAGTARTRACAPGRSARATPLLLLQSCPCAWFAMTLVRDDIYVSRNFVLQYKRLVPKFVELLGNFRGIRSKSIFMNSFRY
jgi:hypothetical protein